MKVLLVFLLYCGILSGQSSQNELRQTATENYENQQYALALESYEALLATDSTDLKLFERAALSAYKLGDLPVARKYFLELEKKDTSSWVALTSLASIYETNSNTPKAIKYYHKLIKHFPDNAINFRKLAQQYQKAGLKNEARNYYEQALEKNNKDQYTIKGLGELYLREKKYALTDSLLNLGLGRDSSNIQFNLLIANSKYLQKAYDSTVYYMEVIRGKYDLRPHQNKMLGYAYMQVDSLDRAIFHLTKAINDPGTKEYAHYNLGVAYEKQGNTEFALHHFQEAVKEGISDDVDLYHRNVARLYAKEEDLKAAIPHYQDAYKYGEDPLVLFYLARASDNYYKDKNIAIRYYTKFIKSNYDHAEYQKYAADRKRYLKELMHLQK